MTFISRYMYQSIPVMLIPPANSQAFALILIPVVGYLKFLYYCLIAGACREKFTNIPVF